MFAQRSLGILVSIAALVSVVVLGILTYVRLDARPRTDDAFLQADLVHMAPDVSGRIVALDVRNNQFVRAGDVLLTIDQEPYQLRVDQARAQVRMLEAELAVQTNQVASQQSKAQASNTSIGSAQAQLALANVTLGRLVPLGARGYVPAEQVDQARTSQRSAQISLQEAQEQARSAQQSVSSTKPTEEQLQGARSSLAQAERDLRLTVVKAPCDGRITSLDIAVGEYAAMGRPLFTLINTERWYAVGNFRETDLAGIQPGQRATVFVLSYPNQPVSGTVESLGWGVTPDEGSTASGGLPRVPRSLEWVRIAQRFPVRVLLQNPPEPLMRVAATAVMVIDR